MTDATASELVNFLVTTFINNRLADIGTFLFPSLQSEQQFEQNDGPEIPVTSEEALLALLSGRTQPKECLRQLLEATRNYFDEGALIPGAFSRAYSYLAGEARGGPVPPINLVASDGETVIDVSPILTSTSVRRIQLFLETLSEHIDDEDDSFLNSIEEL